MLSLSLLRFRLLIGEPSLISIFFSSSASSFFFSQLVDKFINAIVEAVEPRLKGKNLDTLDEFKELFPKVDLTEGDEVEMTIRGDVLLLKTGLGVGTIRSRPFTEAMCDVYFGKDAVSPTLKNDVLKGIPNL